MAIIPAYIAKPIDQITEAEGLSFIQALRDALAKAKTPVAAALPPLQVIRHQMNGNTPMTILDSGVENGILVVHVL